MMPDTDPIKNVRKGLMCHFANGWKCSECPYKSFNPCKERLLMDLDILIDSINGSGQREYDRGYHDGYNIAMAEDGIDVKRPGKECPACGYHLHEDWVWCPRCRYEVRRIGDPLTDKQRFVSFAIKLLPDDFSFRHISLTFNDDGSACILLSNDKYEGEE